MKHLCPERLSRDDARDKLLLLRLRNYVFDGDQGLVAGVPYLAC